MRHLALVHWILAVAGVAVALTCARCIAYADGAALVPAGSRVITMPAKGTP